MIRTSGLEVSPKSSALRTASLLLSNTRFNAAVEPVSKSPGPLLVWVAHLVLENDGFIRGIKASRH